MWRYYKFSILTTFLLLLNLSFAQNTVAVTDYDLETIEEGYTLLYPQRHSNVYLINNCGQVVHEWSDSTIFWPGLSVYLLENGDLLKTKRYDVPIDSSFSGNGAGAIVELRSWDNELKWSKQFANGTYRAHHDVEILPNGNVLVIAWKRRSKDEYIQGGGDTLLFDRDEIWPGVILEYNPELDSVVWEWDSWDHIVQDFDPNRSNFGDVAENKGKIDLNYDLGGYGGRPDWIHFNAVDYNAELDQILLSAAHFEEIWIIDHSTTAEEVKGDTGGNFGKGGQLLFRWGNPRAYKSGNESEQTLHFQHDAQWIDSPALSNSPYYQHIGVFNNRVGTLQSSMDIIAPALDLSSRTYLENGNTYLPNDFEKRIFSTLDIDFYSSNMSSMQLLPNGNFLACASQTGTLVEITPENELAWRYKVPLRNGFRIEQGAELFIGDNVMFRGKKYHAGYDAFIEKNLDPLYYLELEPNEEFCDLSLSTKNSTSQASIYPNPSSHSITIEMDDVLIQSVKIYNVMGELIFHTTPIRANVFDLDVSQYPEGMYYIRINDLSSFPISIQR